MNKEAPGLPQLPTEQDWTPSPDPAGCHASKIVGDLAERV